MVPISLLTVLECSDLSWLDLTPVPGPAVGLVEGGADVVGAGCSAVSRWWPVLIWTLR